MFCVFQSDQEYEEDMKDELDNVMGLLDRMKEERQEEMLSSQVNIYKFLMVTFYLRLNYNHVMKV